MKPFSLLVISGNRGEEQGLKSQNGFWGIGGGGICAGKRLGGSCAKGRKAGVDIPIQGLKLGEEALGSP